MRTRPRIAAIVVVASAGGVLGLTAPGTAEASCVGPVLGIGTAVYAASPPTTGATLSRGVEFTVAGAFFHSGCADTFSSGPGCTGPEPQPSEVQAPLTDVELTLAQGRRTWVLDTESAAADTSYTIRWRVRLPADVGSGPAELRADTASLPVTIGS